MKRQPKLILRESCVADLSAHWPLGRFVEMGAGTGYMTQRFLDRGFTGACHDLGEDSRQMIRQNLAPAGDRIRVVDDLAELAPSSFDYLLAFEVLEHIENDEVALREWMRYLKPNGRILVSVPAHQRKYGRSDEIVGHVRRYEREQLRTLLQNAGCSDVHIVNYGFPVTEATRRLSNWLIRNDRSYEGMTPEQRSIRSAQAKPKVINKVLAPIGDGSFAPFCAIQRWFYERDWGDGYMATAVKHGA